jgi:spore germination protein KA
MGFLNRTITKTFKKPSIEHPDPIKESPKIPINENLQDNIQYIKTTLGNSTDLVVRDFFIGSKQQMKAAIFYTDGLADSAAI